MMNLITSILKQIAAIGMAISLALVVTGLYSPSTIFSGDVEKDTICYENIPHSGPYMIIIGMYNWSVKVWFNEHINGKYRLIWSGEGKYPITDRIFIPSRGYLKILSNTSGTITFQRLSPALQYDYLYQGIYSFFLFFSIYMGVFIWERKTREK
ncbi:MAG: hypothetical protein J7L63_04130 [Thermoplasmata archaeon]|nr:hypothetical protein [Thermoplasmata archaeon]